MRNPASKLVGCRLASRCDKAQEDLTSPVAGNARSEQHRESGSGTPIPSPHVPKGQPNARATLNSVRG